MSPISKTRQNQSQHLVSFSSSFIEHSLDNSTLSFIGQWSLTNEFGTTLYLSSTTGDTVQTTFTGLFDVLAFSESTLISLHKGTSLLLTGTTSSKSGRYSVTLDNATTSLSGQSSFTQQDTLLFFASGLDPEALHEIQVINEDGSELVLITNGFNAFAVEPPMFVSIYSESVMKLLTLIPKCLPDSKSNPLRIT